MSHPEMTRRVTSSSRFAYDFPGFSTESPTCPSPPESWGSVTLAVYQGVTPGHDHHCPEASSGDIHPRGPKVTHTHVPLTGHPPLTSLHIWAALRSLQTQRHVFPGVKDRSPCEGPGFNAIGSEVPPCLSRSWKSVPMTNAGTPWPSQPGMSLILFPARLGGNATCYIGGPQPGASWVSYFSPRGARLPGRRRLSSPRD